MCGLTCLENVLPHLLMKNGEREMRCSLTGIALFVCLITRVAQNVYRSRSRDKRIKPPVTSREQAHIIDDSKIRIQCNGVPRE